MKYATIKQLKDAIDTKHETVESLGYVLDDGNAIIIGAQGEQIYSQDECTALGGVV